MQMFVPYAVRCITVSYIHVLNLWVGCQLVRRCCLFCFSPLRSTWLMYATLYSDYSPSTFRGHIGLSSLSLCQQR